MSFLLQHPELDGRARYGCHVLPEFVAKQRTRAGSRGGTPPSQTLAVCVFGTGGGTVVDRCNKDPSLELRPKATTPARFSLESEVRLGSVCSSSVFLIPNTTKVDCAPGKWACFGLLGNNRMQLKQKVVIFTLTKKSRVVIPKNLDHLERLVPSNPELTQLPKLIWEYPTPEVHFLQ